MKKIIDVTVFKSTTLYSDNENWPPENLLEFQQWLDDKIKSIPVEYRSAATIEIEYEEYYSEITIAYKREETDHEEHIREKEEREDQEKIERRERKILAVLKAKYEGSGNER